MKTEKPNLYEYLDYRDFIKDTYHAKKTCGRGFSYRTFSRLAGFRSSNFIKLIVEGKRNLSHEGIHKIAKALKLNKSETNFFEALVLFDQSKNIDEKNRYYARIAQSKSYNHYKPLEASQYEFFSNWYFVAMRELIQLKNFKEDAKWINQKLQLSLSDDEIKKAIQTLIDLKLVSRGPDNKLKQTDEKISTSPDIASLTVHNFHKTMIRKAESSLESSSTADRDVSALTVSLNEKQFTQLKERMNQFRREIHDIAEQSEDADAVYQINFQLFNLSEVMWRKK